jgi:aromatic-L-amino-acid decarboxylase
MEPDEFRRLGHALVDWIADYRATLAARPVMSPLAPGEVRARFPSHPPEQGGGLDGILAALERDVLPGITHWNHPRFFAYFPSNTTPASVLADLVAAGLGAQGMSWQTSPAATEVEQVTLDWLRQMVGLSDAWTGSIHDTASTATLVALLCARERATAHAQERGGLQEGGPPLVVYASDEGHSSIEKAALLAGFGRDHLRLLPTDDRFALDAAALDAAIATDRAAGRRPCAVVAAIGTTGTTAVDPLTAVARQAAAHGLWLHVDAALAGTAMVAPECRVLWEGVEAADSLVFNPHKWMGTGFDLSAYFVRDTLLLRRVMRTHPVYLRTTQDDAVVNYRDWHLPLGRRFRALKLWFVLLDEGVAGIRARVRRDLALAQALAAEVAATPHWRVVAPVPLQTVCLRHEPPGLTGEALEAHQAAVVEQVNRSGAAYFTPSRSRGMAYIRFSIGAVATTAADVAAGWAALRAAGDTATSG